MMAAPHIIPSSWAMPFPAISQIISKDTEPLRLCEQWQRQKSENSADAKHEPVSEIGFCAWLGQADPDDILVYHRGFLVIDTTGFSETLSRKQQIELARVAGRAWQASELGLIHLLQRRHGFGDYSYLAIARAKGPSKPIPRSPLFLEEAA